MCDSATYAWVADTVGRWLPQGACVLEVGSRIWSNSVKPAVMRRRPSEYIGVDAITGPGVDMMADACELVSIFGEQSFDAVLAVEMLEHCHDPGAALRAMLRALRAGGLLVLTTRTWFYPKHEQPADYWRFDPELAVWLNEDATLIRMEYDARHHGVYIAGLRTRTRIGDADYDDLLHAVMEPVDG